MRHSALLAARSACPVRRRENGSGLVGLFSLIAAVTLLMLGIHLWRDLTPVLEGPSVNAARSTAPAAGSGASPALPSPRAVNPPG